MKGAIKRAVLGHLHRAWFALCLGQRVPLLQSLTQNFPHHFRTLPGIFVGQELAARGQAINTLARIAALAFARALVGHLAEEFSLRVATTTLIPIVRSNRNVVARGKTDDLRIGKGERTARNTVVSGATERVPVHLPKDDRFAFARGLVTGVPKTDAPWDTHPLLFLGLWFDNRMELLELGGANGFGGNRQTNEN